MSELTRINELARQCGMSYGKYVATHSVESAVYAPASKELPIYSDAIERNNAIGRPKKAVVKMDKRGRVLACYYSITEAVREEHYITHGNLSKVVNGKTQTDWYKGYRWRRATEKDLREAGYA